MRTCKISGCKRKHKAKGLCKKHYQKQYAKQWKQDNKERTAKNQRKWAKKDYRKRKKHFLDKSWRQGLKKQFNFTVDDYQNIFIKQQGFCPICGKHQLELTRRLNVDHNHKTGKIRGLLCTWCNMNLGWYEKHKESILNYLKGEK